MIQFGAENDIPELKKLWKQCFDDENAYIDAFFQAMYETEHVLTEKENGVLMGASFFLPGKIYWKEPNHKGRWQPFRLVYALAVYPQFRGRGVAANLLYKAFEKYQVPLIAQPAEEGLVGGFYKPLGFQEAFYLKKNKVEVQQYDVQAAQILPVRENCAHIDRAEAEQYCKIRDASFQKHGYISWPAKHTAFAIQEHCANDGGAYVIDRGGKEDLVLYYRENQNVIVTETTLTDQEVTDIFLPQIIGQCGKLIVTRPSALERNCCLVGMSYGLAPVCGYMNLSLD